MRWRKRIRGCNAVDVLDAWLMRRSMRDAVKAMEPNQQQTPNAAGMGSNTNPPRASSKSTDPARKYSTPDPGNRNNFVCHFCGKLCTGGVYRVKWHFIGGLSDVKECPNCPDHVREEHSCQ
ncbi:hypothetical protein OSB04_023744 [Centaurea solstitialis]|uniref:Uncharacterized protein n=1 Tax=Centaurea solstitialis TaxID=347529 RepID=A0AA38W2J6_9ASTR|nr:hypothetical protein OSB04_023744 [Centaurea solstitialis]